jgi:UPF0716 protein FxsA
MAEGFLLALAGAMLLTPGFVTDGLGFLLLIPATRKLFVSRVIKSMSSSMMSGGGFQATGSFSAGGFSENNVKDVYSQEPTQDQGRQERITIIEGEFTKDDK